MDTVTNTPKFVSEAELVGSPRRLNRNVQNVQGWAWEPVEWSQIVRDAAGDIIFTVTQCKFMLSILSEYLDKPLFSVYFVDNRLEYPDQAAIGLPLGMTLDAAEAAAISLGTWINNRYFPGIKRTAAPSLPHDLNDYSDSPDSPDALVGLDAVFYSLDDANRMATIISTLYRFTPKVVKSGDRWGVVINDDRFLDSRRVVELSGIHKLLSNYAIIPTTRKNRITDPTFAASIAEQAAFETRIEGGINAILSCLGHPSRNNTPPDESNAATVPERPLRRPAKKDNPAGGADKRTSPTKPAGKTGTRQKSSAA